jgi:hypothetical protein
MLFATELAQQFKDSKKEVTLFYYELYSQNLQIITTSAAKQFSPIWIDDRTVEYNDPSSDGKIYYAIPAHPPTQTATSENWKTYSNPEYGFSIDYPSELEVTSRQDNKSLYIGEKINVWVSDINPLDCRGDCPLVENTESTTLAGLQATKVTGYIGAIGGNIPQRYLRYILQRNNRYFIFTLYALSYKATMNDVATIRPLYESDIVLFEQVLKTFKIIEAPISISLDRTDLQSVLKWMFYAISENKPEMFADMIGQKGVSVGRFTSGFNFLGYDNSDFFIGELRKGLNNTSPMCIGYDLYTSTPPDTDKATIYYKNIRFDWTQFGLDKAVNEKIQTNGFLLMKFEEGWELVVIVPVPNDIVNSLSSTLSSCPQ